MVGKILLNQENGKMEEEADIPFPIRFNPFKHHRNYALGIVDGLSPNEIAGLLDPVCNNYIDIYTGKMTPAEIGHAVIAILKSTRVLQSDDFSLWVALSKGYRTILLQDGSEWVVRIANDQERYIHLHPARTGRFTMRFKGSTLKTVCLLKVGPKGVSETPSVENVNRVRVQAGLSPVKRLEPDKGILYCWDKLSFNY